MCGIHASISRTAYQAPSHELRQLLSNRGPDHLGEIQAKIDTGNETSCWISCTSTVLALRGGQVKKQPFQDSSSGCSLCWNGEAWKIDSTPVVGNDGQLVFDLLREASASNLTAAESTAAILGLLRSISGPCAFVYVDANHGLIYFGRDCLGRRSLLYHTNESSSTIELSSCSDPSNPNWTEVEADGIYQLSLSSALLMTENRTDEIVLSNPVVSCQRHAWDTPSSPSSLGVFNRAIPSQVQPLTCQSSSVQSLRKQLHESLKLRVLNVAVPPGQDENHDVRIAVLFSGGLDCTVLARMVHDLLPSGQEIDLLNVAFENPRSINAAKNAANQRKLKNQTAHSKSEDQDLDNQLDALINLSHYEVCPDRATGRKAFHELQNVCPGRIWRFVAVDVPYSETVSHRAKVVSLIDPHNTEMDLSIAYALFFASRGVGMATTGQDQSSKLYSTPARILLSGLGADEIFGGYTRHSTAFRRNGYPALIDELELDVNRLGKRNLGRDDRVISQWGREARFPFLDESLVKWAVECPVWEKCGFQEHPPATPDFPEVDPEKKVLRLLAYDLGMHSVAVEKKRAIQFGARTAKMEVGRTRAKGTQVIS
ncbi:hypothetical protein HYALB_00009542 [Hymenoscyphus albidus]|uniref:Glutamine amidotransferase type-2 domain-containing protein n=1 Tax=Hymenoscyphus albidus TaxID=595503 RepID=A0A9N9M0B3_9HELO|nr:hypothetical protein HYALB_00009542 [Hymenoscyphus albidus]